MQVVFVEVYKDDIVGIVSGTGGGVKEFPQRIIK